MSNIRIAILDMNAGAPNEGMRCLKMLAGDFLSQEGTSGHYDIFEVRIKGEIPRLDHYDIYLSSGGPGSPMITGEAWENKYFGFLDALLLHNLSKPDKKHLFLICHSFQLACLHWDLAKVTRRRSTSFGIYPIFKTKSGEQEILFEGLTNPFFAVDSRDYQVVGPAEWKLDTLDGTVLCREKVRTHVPLERAVMAIRYSKEIFGVQFHPEADSEGMLRHFKKEEKRNLIIKKYGKRKYLNMLEQLVDDEKIMRTNHTVVPRFLKQASEAIEGYKIQNV